MLHVTKNALPQWFTGIAGIRLLPLLVYSVGALLVLGPALGPGYLLTLDMVFAPSMHSGDQFYGLTPNTWASLPYLLVIQGATTLFPSWLVQKFVLFLALMLAGLGAHRLIPFGQLASYYGGFLYMVNPFTQVRQLAGQLTLLISYALIPFAVKSFLDFLKTGRTRDVVKVALWWSLAGVFQLHGFALLALIFFILTAVHLLRAPSFKQALFALVKPGIVGATIFLFINLYWLVPVFSEGGERITSIGSREIAFFAPTSLSGRPVALEVAAMEGFWRARGLVGSSLSSAWLWVPFSGVLLLWANGLVGSLQNRGLRTTGLMFSLIALAGLILALGASTPMTRWVFERAWDNVPLFKGFRDSHKLVALLVLSYAYLGALGLRDLRAGVSSAGAERFRQWSGRIGKFAIFIIVALAFAIPVSYMVRFFGFSDQVNPTSYPVEWYEARQFIANDPQPSNILVLPWHQYLDIGWLPQPQKRVTNPASLFMGPSTISGDTIEVGPGSPDLVSQYVELLLKNRTEITNLGELLTLINVKYVVLLKEVDYSQYSFLDQQHDLKPVLSNDRLSLFENAQPVSRVYGASSIQPVESMQAFLELSRTQNVREHVYVLDTDVENSISTNSDAQLTVKAEKNTSVRISESSDTYAVLANGQRITQTGWEFQGRAPVLIQLGFMPVFQVNGAGGTIQHTAFSRQLLWLYLISSGTILAAAGVLWPRAKTSRGFVALLRRWKRARR
jgi:hypothetical protein